MNQTERSNYICPHCGSSDKHPPAVCQNGCTCNWKWRITRHGEINFQLIGRVLDDCPIHGIEDRKKNQIECLRYLEDYEKEKAEDEKFLEEHGLVKRRCGCGATLCILDVQRKTEMICPNCNEKITVNNVADDKPEYETDY